MLQNFTFRNPFIIVLHICYSQFFPNIFFVFTFPHSGSCDVSVDAFLPSPFSSDLSLESKVPIEHIPLSQCFSACGT
jgi:hypothetical protein